jgi:hypothetical protein
MRLLVESRPFGDHPIIGLKASIAKTLIGCEAPFRKQSGTQSNARRSLPFRA